MTSKRLFQLSLALPILVPALCAPLWFLREAMNETAGLIYMIVVYSGLVGGIPYLILAIALLIWMREKRSDVIRKALTFSPLIMLGIFVICYAIFKFVLEAQPTFNETLWEYLLGVMVFGVFILIFGYIYVGITLGFEKLRRMN